MKCIFEKKYGFIKLDKGDGISLLCSWVEPLNGFLDRSPYRLGLHKARDLVSDTIIKPLNTEYQLFNNKNRGLTYCSYPEVISSYEARCFLSELLNDKERLTEYVMFVEQKKAKNNISNLINKKL